MPTQASETPGTPEPNPIVTLAPLADGSDALAPDDTSEVAAAQLTRLDLAWDNAFHEVTTVEADDLFRCAAAQAGKSPIPKGAEPTRATLHIHLKDSLEPHAVEFRPPATISYHHPTDAPRLASFLSRHRFIAAQKAAHVLALLLALTGAIVPDFDDDTPDDDDDPAETHHCPV